MLSIVPSFTTPTEYLSIGFSVSSLQSNSSPIGSLTSFYYDSYKHYLNFGLSYYLRIVIERNSTYYLEPLLAIDKIYSILC